jgi:hypothetical protein
MSLVENQDHTKAVYGFTAADNRIAHDFYKALGYQLYEIPNYYGRGHNAFVFHKVVKEE